MEHRLFLLGAVVLQILPFISGYAWVNVELLVYNNSAGIKYDGTCCDQTGLSCQVASCDLQFSACSTSEALSNDECPDDNDLTKQFGPFDNVNFIILEDIADQGDRENPMSFQVEVWQGSMEFQFVVTDKDGSNYETVDTFTAMYTRTEAYSKKEDLVYQPYTLTGSRSIIASVLNVQIGVFCGTHYYGPRCDVFCQDGYDGHYTCDKTTGEKICSPGWTGADCKEATVHQCPGVDGPVICGFVDLYFILDNSGSINAVDPENWSRMLTYIQDYIDAVNVSDNAYKVGVVWFGNTGRLKIPLGSNATEIKEQVGALQYQIRRTNLIAGLETTRLEGFKDYNGARNQAYKAAILLWDGEKPNDQYLDTIGLASKLRTSGVEVFVLPLSDVLNNFTESIGIANNIASFPTADHLFILNSYSQLGNYIDPTISQIQSTCNNGGGTTTTWTTGTRTMVSETTEVTTTGTTVTETAPNDMMENTPTETTFTTESATNVGLVVGVTVGAVCVTAGIIVTILILCRQNKTKKSGSQIEANQTRLQADYEEIDDEYLTTELNHLPQENAICDRPGDDNTYLCPISLTDTQQANETSSVSRPIIPYPHDYVNTIPGEKTVTSMQQVPDEHKHNYTNTVFINNKHMTHTHLVRLSNNHADDNANVSTSADGSPHEDGDMTPGRQESIYLEIEHTDYETLTEGDRQTPVAESVYQHLEV